MHVRGIILGLLSLAAAGPLAADDSASRVLRPEDNGGNAFYVGNRAPLIPSPLVKLPVGAIRPRGWLQEYLRRQSAGLTGHLGEISVWLQKKDNAWLSPDGKGQYGWEELPYWLKGYGDLAYILDDPAMIAETRVWIEGALGSQRPDGDFGPDRRFDDDGTRDYWANMVMLFCLQSYYEHSGDPRVITLMTRYFRHLLEEPDSRLLTHYWQKMRGGDNLYSVYWLYDRTGTPFLLDLGRKLHRLTANWEMHGDLPSWHNVNIAQGFREPATYSMQSHDPADLKATYDDFHLVRQRYGQVPGGMFGGDENCRPGYSDPRQAIETCGIVEQMLSDEILLRVTGDSVWADHCEEVAFNTFPAAVTADFRALRYLTAPNMAVSDDKDHSPGIGNSGPYLMMNPFSSRCCQHNHSQGWPYFAECLWLGTPDNGLCAALYAPGVVSAQVGDGTPVRIDEETEYPFRDTLRLTLHAPKPTGFPLYLRIPRWCSLPSLKLNGAPVPIDPSDGDYLRIERIWSDGDQVVLTLPFSLRVRRWEFNAGSATVDYGPLTFSLDIPTEYVRVDSTRSAQGDAAWQPGAKPAEWPSTILRAKGPWNYALVLGGNPVDASFVIESRPFPHDNFPFTPESSPIVIHARAKLLPEWKLDAYGLVAPLPMSPVAAAGPVQDISLIPMGAARLRISAFPVAK